jgi:PAS domain S-box-containing protein
MNRSVDISSELAEARRRLTELEAVEAERAHAAKVQDALYRIAELASAAGDMQEFYRAVHEVVGELMYARNFFIALYDDERKLISWPYWDDEVDFDWPDPNAWIEFGTREARGSTAYVLRTGEPQWLPRERQEQLIAEGEIELWGEISEDWLGVPLTSDGRSVGALVVQSYSKEFTYTEQDKELLAYVGQHAGAALSRARAIEETRQRNAELALINSVQEALAGELELQAIYDVVGDKLQEVFDAQVLSIAVYDEATGLQGFPYVIERGERFEVDPRPVGGFTKHVLESGEPLMLNESIAEVAERYGSSILVGDEAKSALFVPLLAGGKATGVVSLQNVDREHAFTESDQRLLVTLAGSLSVALENARLVHETRQRNAELGLINSVQEALAGELELQAIYDVVGDKIQEIFDAQVVDIGIFDFEAGLTHYPYTIERGVRFPDKPISMMRSPTTQLLFETKAPVQINDVPAWELERGVQTQVIQGEPALSVLVAPLVSGDELRGRISLQNLDRTNAFSETDVRLLTTLAASLSVALDNARLVHETRQRNAELALINSVQQSIAGELDQQAIYDLVGDKLQEVFDAQVLTISIYEEATGLQGFPYVIERGERFEADPRPVGGFTKHVLESGEPLMINESFAQVAERYGSSIVVGEVAKSALFVPLLAGGKATGVVSLQNVDREHAFSDSDQQLLETLARSLSVALENARLVLETRQRNAELALINSVQEALAGELDLQAIYDVVGDKIRDVFDAQTVIIATLDKATGLQHFPYIIERGERMQQDPIPLSGFTKRVIETREPLMINEDAASAGERYGSAVVGGGEMPKSVLFVPLLAGGKATGVVSLQNVDREHAFTESDQRLLLTLAGGLSVALDNARLVHETRQRNAELALINDVQAAIAGELDPQAIYDLVGDKLQAVFDAQVVNISVYDRATGLLEFPYVIERGKRLHQDPIPLIGFRKHVVETREPLMLNEDLDAASERYGNPRVLHGEPARSCLFVPLVAGGSAIGVVSLQNLDRENAFTNADLSVLTTLAGSLTVALENARLVEETRQRVAELATVNSVGQALASQLELEALIELVGERVRETFEADIAYVALHDEAAGQIDFVYYYEPGEENPEPLPYGEGLTSQILDTREPLLLNRQEHYEGLTHVGTPSRSYLGVPILVGEKAIGVISVQSTREEGRFGDDDTRLLATIAANVGVAIQKARLFGEIGRQKQYFESLVEVSPAAVVVMDVDERVTGWNPAATELFGYSSEEATGRAIDDLVLTEELRREGRDVTSEALEKGRVHRITRRARKDGALVDVEMMLVPLGVGGEHVGFYGIYHDITELQRAREEAEAATQAKSAFLATMSHEIRTPMNAVIGMTGLLLGTDLTPEQREFAEVVRSSGDALLHVIDDILDYSKIEAGKLELEKEPVDLRECVEGALEIAAPRAWEKEIELGCLIDEDAPAGIVADAARLRQVLLNLLSNAVKFTEEGEVVVQVDAEPAAAGSFRLAFAVRDTGIGIPEDRMDRLFTSFSQVDASTTRRYGGSGLGLAISKRLVELMGGTMWVESEVGKGSMFHFDLPVEAAEVPARVEAQGLLPQLGEKRVLVVDDNATNREIVTRHARSWGMEPVAIASPTEALARIEEGEQFDVAVLDMMMPELDGLALAREIRRHQDEQELPLVLLTSLGRLPQAQSAGEFAVQLSKPVRASQLYNALVKALAAHVPKPGERVPDEGKPATSPLRILLAEDNAVNQQVALKLLEQLSYRADVASNGLEALAALERQAYDVVLMDVQMPELDGLEASRRICERWPAQDRPRIIAMTANAMPEDRAACFAAWMDDYLAKPIRPNELGKALRRARSHEDTRTPSEAARDAALDAGALENLRELGGEAFLAEVIDTFLSDAPALVAALRTSHEQGDAEELRRAAHTLKSNGQTFGAGRFSELCRALEERARVGDVDGAEELVDRIEREYGALEETLGALRATAAS